MDKQRMEGDGQHPQEDIEMGTAHGPVLQRNATKTRLLSSVPLAARITVECVNVCAFVPVLLAPSTKPAKGKRKDEDDKQHGDKEKEKAPKERQVLFNVSACVEPGEMLALMGPSGSGKSSLLTLMGGRSTARYEGSITFGGQPLAKGSKRKLGYVAQDDLLFAELTVFETLYFAAMLRLPRSWMYEQKLERVEMVLAGLGLDRCRDTIIGNHMMRGVSGGERKRVSIGHELLINPSVIFLDEPTSGLDSTTALNLMHTLRGLASGGRTIVTSIHQPSSRLYQQVDKLLLLAEGYTMYYGDAHVAAHWFDSLGQPVPFGVSTADHILDLACGDLPGHDKAESQAIMHYLTQAYRDRTVGQDKHGILPHHLGKAAVQASETMRRDRMLEAAGGPAAAAQPDALQEEHQARPQARGEEGGSVISNESAGPKAGLEAAAAPASPVKPWGSSDVAPSVSSSPEVTVHMAAGTKGDADGGFGDGLEDGKGGKGASGSGSEDDYEEEGLATSSKWGASWGEQVKYLSQRSLKTRRFSALSIQRICECLVVSVLAGLFWWQAGAGTLTAQSALDVGGLLFFEVLFLSFSTMFQAIFNYPPEFSMLVKERQSGMYRLSAYYVARSLADLPMDCALPSLLVWIMYWMAGLRISAAAFFANWGAILLTVLLAQSIGLLIGAMINNVKTCMTTATIFMLTIMLVGGYYVRGIPVWIAWLKYVSFIYYAWNLTLNIEFNHRAIDPSACPGSVSECTVATAHVYPIDVDAVPVTEACVLIAMLIVLRVGTYIALNRKTTFKTHHSK